MASLEVVYLHVSLIRVGLKSRSLSVIVTDRLPWAWTPAPDYLHQGTWCSVSCCKYFYYNYLDLTLVLKPTVSLYLVFSS